MRKPLVVRILSSLDTRAWIAMAVFLGLALAVVPVLHLALPEESPFHVSTYAITLLGKIMCYALVAVAMDLIWGYGGILSLGHGLFFALGGYAFGMYLMRQIGHDAAELPAFMVFLDWKELPWFWLGSDNFLWVIALVVAVPALGLWWLGRKRRDPAFRDRFDAWLLQRKLAGPLLAKLETARLARTLGTLLKNGVPLLSALGISRNVLGNRALAADVDQATEDVKNGHGLSSSLGKGKRFPRLALQMVQVGEESGALDTMLLKTADTFEQETSVAMDRLLAALVPAVTLVLALVVGLVILAVLSPIYDLTSVVG